VCCTMLYRKYLSCENAFTLLEVLITLAIMGIIFFAIFSVYNNTLTLTEGFDAYVELNQVSQAIIDVTSRDIQSVYYKQLNNSTEGNLFRFIASTRNEDEYSEEGRVILSLATTADLSFTGSFPSKSINLVRYLLKDNNGLYTLIREQKRTRQTRWNSIEIAENIKSFTFHFIGFDGHEFDEWDSRDKKTYGSVLPALVRVKFEIKQEHLQKEFEYFIPVKGWSVQNGTKF